MNLILALLLNATAILITDSLIEGIHIQDFQTAVLAALVMGVINTSIKPLLSFLTAPTNFWSLTLFTFVVNAVLLYLASLVISGLIINDVWSAVTGAIVLSLVASVLAFLFKKARSIPTKEIKKKR